MVRKLLIAISTGLLLSASVSAHEGNCTWCKGQSYPGGHTDCLVEIRAPTFGGTVRLDVRDESLKSRWGLPRIKVVGPGMYTYKIGCVWLNPPTAEVVLCVNGPDGAFMSIHLRSKGDLDDAITSHHLDLCLKGDQCPDFKPGPPPAF